jgi:hypothetical protein
MAAEAAEAAAIAEAKAARAKRTPRVKIAFKQSRPDAIDFLGGGHDDQQGWLARLENAFGTRGEDFALHQINHLLSVCRKSDGLVDGPALNAMVAMIEAAKPEDELQAALAVQMAMTHALTTVAIKRAARVDQIPQFDSAGNMAVKLARTFTMQTEALAKLQRRGEQVVKVVHVHQGGQAIVGDVHATRAGPVSGANGANGDHGGGAGGKTDDRPHAKAELPAPSACPMPQVWSQDPGREPVPIASRRG